MFVLATLFATLVGTGAIAQVTPPPAMPAVAVPGETLNNGPCMDSPRAVPQVLQPPAVRSMQIVRVDKIVSTATLLQNETIGFLYTLEDQSTWIGQRTPDYMSPANARAMNQVLASTHLPDQAVTAFPPQTKLGVATKYQQYFKVQLPATAYGALKIRLDPCVAWPAGRDLPDPTM